VERQGWEKAKGMARVLSRMLVATVVEDNAEVLTRRGPRAAFGNE